jgi:DNA-binding NarL/FixJ family response regulator
MTSVRSRCRRESGSNPQRSTREVDVLRAIARGQSTKEIARTLGISPKTVDNHTQSIYAKIAVKTRGGATLFAIEHGFCGP